MEKQLVVVLGAGFGGLRAALQLDRGLRTHKLNAEYEVVLVDQNQYHTYTPLLTETATAIDESPAEQRADAAVELTVALRGTGIRFLCDRVTDIDPVKRAVALGSGQQFSYAVLLMALGGEVNYFDIPGLADNAIPLKTLADAHYIAGKLKALLASSAASRIVIGGGGPTGVELAGALSAHSLQITLIEAQPSILPGFLSGVIARVAMLLEKDGVQILTGKRITAASAASIALEGNLTIPSDLFIWTGGVKASSLVNRLAIKIDHGRAAVDGSLLCLPPTDDFTASKDIYAIGDAVCFHDPRTGASMPWVARAALDQADIAAYNILERVRAIHVPGYIPRPRTYMPRLYPYVIPVGRHQAVAHLGSLTITGEIARVVKWLVELHYLAAVLPFGKALHMWWSGRKLTV
jgi:NADH dehydrogenase